MFEDMKAIINARQTFSSMATSLLSTDSFIIAVIMYTHILMLRKQAIILQHS